MVMSTSLWNRFRNGFHENVGEGSVAVARALSKLIDDVLRVDTLAETACGECLSSSFLGV